MILAAARVTAIMSHVLTVAAENIIRVSYGSQITVPAY